MASKKYHVYIVIAVLVVAGFVYYNLGKAPLQEVEAKDMLTRKIQQTEAIRLPGDPDTVLRGYYIYYANGDEEELLFDPEGVNQTHLEEVPYTNEKSYVAEFKENEHSRAFAGFWKKEGEIRRIKLYILAPGHESEAHEFQPNPNAPF